MQNLLKIAVASVIGTLGYSIVAYAQDAQLPQKAVSISLTPRLWFTFENPVEFNSNPNFQQSLRSANYPLYGLSAEVSTRSLPDWSLILTGYYGEVATIGNQLQLVPALGVVRTGALSPDFHRYDVELLGRHLVAPNISLIGGFRSIHYDETITSIITNIFLNTPLAPISSPNRQKISKQYYLAELGALINSPFSESGRHSLFAGGTIGMGAATTNYNATAATPSSLAGGRSSTSFFVTTLDVNAGYQFLLTQSIALNVRYRAVLFAGETGEFPSPIGITHGPEVGVTMRF
jgi:hypothetical protein